MDAQHLILWAVVLANLFLRLGLSSERDREADEANRDYFAQHGRWPDD